MRNKVQLGVDEEGRSVFFRPDAQHSILCGQTRSGKSVGAYRLLAEISMIPWVRFTGVDPTGILLGPASEGKRHDFALGTSPQAIDHAIHVLHNVEHLTSIHRWIGVLSGSRDAEMPLDQGK